MAVQREVRATPSCISPHVQMTMLNVAQVCFGALPASRGLDDGEEQVRRG